MSGSSGASLYPFSARHQFFQLLVEFQFLPFCVFFVHYYKAYVDVVVSFELGE
jgi:hypothetical protein